MSVRVMALVWELTQVTQSNELLVLLAIADWADDEGVAYPRVPQLAKKARLSEREAQRCIANIKNLGELEVVLNAGPKMSNLYRVTIQRPGVSLAPVTASHQTNDDGTGAEMVTGRAANGDQRAPAFRNRQEPSPEPSEFGTNVPSSKAVGHPRIQAFYDGIKEAMTCCQMEFGLSAQDRQQIIHASMPPADIARAFVDLMDPHRGWGSPWLNENKSVWAVIRNINSWYSSELNPNKPRAFTEGRVFRNY